MIEHAVVIVFVTVESIVAGAASYGSCVGGVAETDPVGSCAGVNGRAFTEADDCIIICAAVDRIIPVVAVADNRICSRAAVYKHVVAAVVVDGIGSRTCIYRHVIGIVVDRIFSVARIDCDIVAVVLNRLVIGGAAYDGSAQVVGYDIRGNSRINVKSFTVRAAESDSSAALNAYHNI